jgi:hypothetical protein
MLVVKSVLRAARSKSFFAALSVLLMIAGTLFGANVASGGEVWNQSYPRGSQSDECVAQPGETPWPASWGTNPGWSPSWAQYAIEGQGGWVCNRSITWAQTPVPASSSSGGSSSVTYALGDTGPGGGLVFLISGGLTYEMAPKTWNGGVSDPSALEWCSNTTTSIAGAAGTAIGTGAQNTVEMDAGCTSGAGQEAADYVAGGKSDWFLPSKDLVNEMDIYQGSIVDTATYGFTASWYWSSSQSTADKAWSQSFQLSLQVAAFKTSVNALVRPVRAF